MKNNCVIAVDQGNKLIKTAPYGTIFSAGINDHRDSAPISIKGIDMLKYEGNYYTIDSQHIPNCANKSQERRYLLLTLMGIAKELIIAEKAELNMGEEEHFPEGYKISGSIILALGLPPADYNRYMDDYMNVFTNRGLPYRFEFNGVEFIIRVSEVFVFPQGFAAITSHSETLEKMKEKSISVIDIGGYTTDTCTLAKGHLEHYRTFPRLGMNGLYAAINASVQNKYDEHLRDIQIDEILEGHSSQLQDVQDTVLEATETYAFDLINRLREEGIQLQLSTPVFVGGGALRLGYIIRKHPNIRNPIWVDDICANARGYYALTLSQLNAAKAGNGDDK